MYTESSFLALDVTVIVYVTGPESQGTRPDFCEVRIRPRSARMIYAD